MKASRYALFAAVPLAIASLAYAGTARRSAPPETKPLATPTGPGVSCIPLNQITATQVRDDYTIDFIRSGKTAWRNRLTAPCGGLKSNNAITYETSLSQLCSSDIVYVLETTGGTPRRGGACSIGQFVPVELER